MLDLKKLNRATATSFFLPSVDQKIQRLIDRGGFEHVAITVHIIYFCWLIQPDSSKEFDPFKRLSKVARYA